MKLLIVEDELDLNRSLVKLLKTQAYSVDAAYDGEEALDYLATTNYDALVVDVMMPRMDGFTLIQTLRQQGKQTPVLFLTAKDSLEDKVRGLDLGADDYLVKPFEFPELLARLRAITRREQTNVTSSLIQIGPISLDLTSQQVWKADQLIPLTAKEYEILAYLMSHRGQILSRDRIREHVWDFDYEGDSNNIEVLIKNIRRKLQESSKNSFIQTKRGLGYVIL
ncbi:MULTISPECIES: response regulator transcription factor [unclassified Streptococcus]|uniref:response regulator transcription factor n=1 Tax=unclassified Streptococcus TaxID=2608887 RepID=UPI0010726DD9|nr:MULTISPECIES: response regulator transcription factor [unclassified Streptococcus]MBF0806579.1 response regulator transcription factor [Streptococcus sp. 19428wA2_WM07]TFU27358.1 response regulator transcription factor [Streptococcus sp. WM07]